MFSSATLYQEGSGPIIDTQSIDDASSVWRRAENGRVLSLGDYELDGRLVDFSSPLEGKTTNDFLTDGRADFISHDLPLSPVDRDSSPSPFAVDDSFSSSPAAAFLAAFSPPVSSSLEQDPDDEGSEVEGWTLGSVIGHGGFSTVRTAYSPSGGTAAVKIVKKIDIEKQPHPNIVRRQLSHEAEIWASLSHEHVLPLFSVCHNSFADFYFSLHCPGGTLFDILKREGQPGLPRADVGMMFRQVVRGVRYLHESAGLVHRDLKLENVLVDEMGICRITDFGMTRRIGELDAELDEFEEQHGEEDCLKAVPARRHTKAVATKYITPHLRSLREHSRLHRSSTPLPSGLKIESLRSVQPGSLPYAAPELLLPQMSGPLLPHPAQDVWALGIMLYTMLVGAFPFRDSFEPRLQMKILHGAYDMPKSVGGACSVIEGCLQRSPSERWSIAMVDDEAWLIESDAETHTTAGQDGEDLMFSISLPDAPVFEEPSESSPLPREESKRDLESPSLDASRRRSASRGKRSRSRAPVCTGTYSSLDRHLVPSSVARSSTAGPMAAHGWFPQYFDDSDPLSSPITSPSSVDRGRTKTVSQLSHSRSPSVSVAPATPTDALYSERDAFRGRRRRSPSFRSHGLDFVPCDADFDSPDELHTWHDDAIRRELSPMSPLTSHDGRRPFSASTPHKEDSPLDRQSVRTRSQSTQDGHHAATRSLKVRRADSVPPASSWYSSVPSKLHQDSTPSLLLSRSRGQSRRVSISPLGAGNRSFGCGV